MESLELGQEVELCFEKVSVVCHRTHFSDSEFLRGSQESGQGLGKVLPPWPSGQKFKVILQL